MSILQFWLKNLTAGINHLAELFSKLPFFVKLIVIFSLVVGSYLRYLGLFSFGFYFDTISTQFDWGKSALEFGFFDFWNKYPKDKLYDYPPISLLYQMSLAWLGSLFGGDPKFFVLFHKLVQWVVDFVFLGLIGYLFSKNPVIGLNIKALILSLVYLLPSIWYVSGVWGQNDLTVFMIGFIGFLVLVEGENWSIFNNQIWYKSSYFTSGIIWSLAIWTKQQPLLFAPVIALYFLTKINWLDLIKSVTFMIPFLALISLAIFNFTKTESSLNLFGNSISNWLFIRDISLVILIALPISLFIFRNIQSNLKLVIWWSMGFFTITNILSIPLMFVNYQRFGSVVFTSVARHDFVSQGGSTFWAGFKGLKEGSQRLIQTSELTINGTTRSFGITVSQAGTLLFLTFLVISVLVIFNLNWKKIFNLKTTKKSFANLSLTNNHPILNYKLQTSDWIWLLWVVCSSYFFFLTKMHSRYLHYGIALGWLGLATIPNLKVFKIGLIWLFLANIVYFLNQLMVLAVNNDYPQWGKRLIARFDENNLNLDMWHLMPFAGSFIFFCTFVWLLLDYHQKYNRKYQKTVD